MKMIDTPEKTTGKAHDLKAHGVEAVGVYLRKDRCDKNMIDGLRSVGIKIVSVYEKGFPTKVTYFTASQGKIDGQKAVAFAQSIAQPLGSEIFSAVDYDASPKHMGQVRAYQEAFQKEVKKAGYLASVYGSGLVCKTLVKLGYAHSGWLSGSKGWAGYKDYEPVAAISQTVLDTTLLGMDVDYNVLRDPSVCWG